MAKLLPGGDQYARSLIEASLDPLVTISTEGKITDVNEATVKVTGVAREQLIGSDFSLYFTEPEKAREGYQRAFAEGLVADYPLTIRHGDGKLTDVLYNASVYKDTHGNVLGVFAAARDITDRKRREAILQEIRSFAEAIVETVREPLLVLDQDLHVMMANESFLRTFRASKAETEGHLLYELGNGQWDIAELRRLLEDIVPQHTEFRDFEVTHDFPAIGRRTMLLNARKLYQPGVDSELFLLAMEDTTARKQAEAGAAQGRGLAERDFQQRQLLEHRHGRERRHPDIQRRRRAHAGLHGRRRDEQDHPGRHLRSAGGDRARQGALASNSGRRSLPASRPWCSRPRAASKTSTS